MQNPIEITEKTINKMIKIAKDTRKNAFCCRSMHKIWASILTENWNIYWWCNIESMISGLWTCAERCAIDNMITHWECEIVAVCTIDSKFTPTCWACLQYIMLFSQIFDKDILLINWDIRGHYKIKKLSELLPEWYKTPDKNIQAMKKLISWYKKNFKK